MSTQVRALLLVGLLGLVVAMWVFSFASKRLESVAAGVAPLEPRRFEGLTVVAAGTGGTYENHQRLGPCVLVGLSESAVLVDAGRGTAQALRRARIPMAQPAVLLTSLLPENTLGLDDWLWAVRLAAPYSGLVVGPPGTKVLVEALRAAHAQGERAGAAALGVDPAAALEIHVVDANDGFATQIGSLGVRATEQRGGPLSTLAWRIEGGGRSVLVSGAGFDPEALVAAARGVDAWVHEALYGASLDQALAAGGSEALAREAALHTRLEDVGALATRAGAKRLVLLRLRPPPVFAFQYVRLVARTYRGLVEIPEDGDELPL